MHGYDSSIPPEPYWNLVDIKSLRASRLVAPCPTSTYPKSPLLASSFDGTAFGSLDLALILKGKSAESVRIGVALPSPTSRIQPSLVIPGTSGRIFFHRNTIYTKLEKPLNPKIRVAAGIPTYQSDYLALFSFVRSPSRILLTISSSKGTEIRPLMILDALRMNMEHEPNDNTLPLRKRYHVYPNRRLLITIPLSDDRLLLTDLPAWK